MDFEGSLKTIYNLLKDSSSQPDSLYLLSIDEIKEEGFSSLLSDFGIFVENKKPVEGFFSYDPFFELTPFSKESRRQIVIKDHDYLKRLYDIFDQCWQKLKPSSEENIKSYIH